MIVRTQPRADHGSTPRSRTIQMIASVTRLSVLFRLWLLSQALLVSPSGRHSDGTDSLPHQQSAAAWHAPRRAVAGRSCATTLVPDSTIHASRTLLDFLHPCRLESVECQLTSIRLFSFKSLPAALAALQDGLFGGRVRGHRFESKIPSARRDSCFTHRPESRKSLLPTSLHPADKAAERSHCPAPAAGKASAMGPFPAAPKTPRPPGPPSFTQNRPNAGAFSGGGEGGSDGGEDCSSDGGAPPEHSCGSRRTARRGRGAVAEVGAAADAVVVVAAHGLRRGNGPMVTETQRRGEPCAYRRREYTTMTKFMVDGIVVIIHSIRILKNYSNIQSS